MSIPVIALNNRAFVQVKVPFDAAVTTHRVYSASGPNEQFVFRRAFVPVNVGGSAFDYWNHAEFGLPDDGSRPYRIKITDVKAGVESALESSPPLEIPVAAPDTTIPIFVKKNPGAALVDGEFIISLKTFQRFRLVIDATVPAGFVQFRVLHARKRAGPFRFQNQYIPGGAVTTLSVATFKKTDTDVSSAELDITEADFVKIQAQNDGGAAQIGIDIERLVRRP